MAKAVSGNSQINVPFSLIQTPIDYFSLETNHFPAPFQTTKNLYNLKAGEYFSLKKHYANFDYDKKETIVLNFQVGQGKTTLCYDLIQEYDKRGYFVLVCSPFTKLVNKDYGELKSRFGNIVGSGGIKGTLKKIFKYDDYNKKERLYIDGLEYNGDYMADLAPVTHNIHIMTINCLLGNGGDSFEQTFLKQNYIQNLLGAAKGRKVVLFIDEIHESIHNFNSLLIPNLLKWNGIAHKVFIASATYTAATIPIIKSFSVLTNKEIQILEAKRRKNKLQADIHLHILDTSLSDNSSLKNEILKEAKKYQMINRPVNIITGYKLLAENISKGFSNRITSASNSNLPYSPNRINVLTGDTDIDFQTGKNNIGTTFKTGADIKDKNGVLFVAFPQTGENTNSNKYGIFTDGISSIIQSIGRLRNGGKIHLFINSPDILIGNNQNYPSLFNNKNFISHIEINKSLDETLKKYKQVITAISPEIQEMERGLSGTGFSSYTMKEDFGFWYPNEQEFILKNSQTISLSHDNVSFGRLLSPYIIWSCLNDQFINGTLKSIKYYRKSAIKLTTSNAANTFNSILNQHNGTLKGLGFRKSINNIHKYLAEGQDQNGNPEQLEFEIDGKRNTVGQIINRKPNLLKEVAKQTFITCTRLNFPDTKEKYINSCINEAHANKTVISETLRKEYYDLGIIKADFITRIKAVIKSDSNKNYILYDSDSIIDNTFFDKAMKVIENLKEHDLLIKNKAFSMMQENFAGTDKKKRLYKLFTGLFLTLGNTKQIGKKKYIEVLDFDPMAGISLPGLL